MRVRTLTLKLLALACTATCMGATFTWTAGGADDDWDNTDNWFATGCLDCYPDDTNDDATIPYTAGGYTVDLVTESIDDFAIAGSVDFYSASGGVPQTLTVQSLSIGAASAETVITISGATISVE